MDPLRWQRIGELFAAASRLDSERRIAFLENNCGQDQDLFEQLKSLLDIDDRPGVLDTTPTVSTLGIPEIVAGRFRIIRRIAEGGMGTVYEAEDLQLHDHVALKTIRPEIASDLRAVERFRQEIRLGKRVTHPNICRIYDLGTHRSESGSEFLFLTMQFLGGETLSSRIRRGPVPQSEALPLIEDMADALSAAHEAEVIHRDFKSGNVILVPCARRTCAVVTDFGLARGINDGASLTRSGLVGTVDYMAPEQIIGGEITPSTDIYALGVVMYEMVTGQLPFTRDSKGTVVQKHLNDEPRPPRDLVPQLDANWNEAILRCLKKLPGDRFQSGTELKAAVAVKPSMRTKSLRRLWPPPRSGGIRSWLWRRRFIVITTAVLLGVFILRLEMIRFGHESRQTSLALIPSQKNVVVLPFTAVGGGSEEQVYCDGFTETVTAKLANDPSLQVPSALETRAKNVTSIERARTQLGANLVLVASWQHAEQFARINLSLIDAQTGQQLRTETITEPATDLFSLQDQVVLAALRMLQVEPSFGSAKQLMDHGTTVSTAYDFYVQGIGYLQRFERLESVEAAITLLQRAVNEDHDYAQAQAALAQAYWYKYSHTKEPVWAESAKAAVKSAEALDSRLLEVQLAIGNLNRRTGAFQSAQTAYQHVLKIDPQNIDAYLGLGYTYDSLGRTAEAEHEFRRAIEIRPACWSCYNALGDFLNKHSRYGGAADAWNKVTELAPDNVWGYMNVGVTYFNTGQFDKAREYFHRALQIEPNDPDLYSNMGTTSFFLGHFEEDVQFMEKAIAIRPQKYEYWGNLADAYRMIPGNSEKAKSAYKRAISLAGKRLKVNPRDADVLSSLALYHSRVGDAVQAQHYLQRALHWNQNDADILLVACLVHLEAGQKQASLKWLAKSVRAGYRREYLTANPELVNLRSEPEFSRIVSESPSFN